MLANWIISLFFCFPLLISGEEYFGKKQGRLKQYEHGVGGEVYVSDSHTIYLRDFSYDGRGPDAFFYVGTDSARPNSGGILVSHPPNSGERVLRKYDREDVVLSLPREVVSNKIKWFSVWCRQYAVNFGELIFPANVSVPEAQTIDALSQLAHGVSSDPIVVKDIKTLFIVNLQYDGRGPDVHFWAGKGPAPSENGFQIPDERGTYDNLGPYYSKDVLLTLPGNKTVYDIDWLSIWCSEFKIDFGSVIIPKNLNNLPPHFIKEIPENEVGASHAGSKDLTNCRPFLGTKLQVRWASDSSHAHIQLSAKLNDGQWFAFGVSGDQNAPQMIGSDVIVAYYDVSKGRFMADDYYLSGKSQCSGGVGVCTDENQGGRNNVEVVRGNIHDGITTVYVKRPLAASESRDISITPFGVVNMIAAMGTLNSRNEANYHDQGWSSAKIDFGAINRDSCGGFSDESSVEIVNVQPWKVRKIMNELVFKARIGPTGGDRGYKAVTGRPSWGIAWWINGLLIPEIYVQRGETYTFIVEGGSDPGNPAKYHPFYITDSAEGGILSLNETSRTRERVFAGIGVRSGRYRPTAVGRLCKYDHKGSDQKDSVSTFEEYRSTLQLKCSPGEPAKLVWTVKDETPDLVYYHCATHRNLGWRIHVKSRTHSRPVQEGAASYSMVSPMLLFFVLTSITMIL